MAKTRQERTNEYNKKAYKQYNFRVRRDSKLYEFLEANKEIGNPINELVVEKLEAHRQHLVSIGLWES